MFEATLPRFVNMPKMSSILATIACAYFASLSALALGAPKSVKATYAGFFNGMAIGTITEVFESDGATYRIVRDVKPSGLAALVQRQPLRSSSTGQVMRDGLHPVQFEERRNANDAPQVSAEFDWTRGSVVLKRGGRIETVALPTGTQDRLSIMYQFMYWPPERLRQLDFAMTDGRKVDHYSYRATPDVEIDTGLGRLKTLHLVKQREPGETVTEVWLSSQHQNFPVKLLIVERNGNRLEHIVQTLEVRD